jgi:uncharacterized protein YhaN
VKITDIQVDGFGVWKGLTVESLSDEMTVFYGENEAGKTTLMQFIRSMMFGFSPDRLQRYTPPVYGGLAGGMMDVVTKTGPYEIQRHVDPNRLNDNVGDLVVTDAHDGSVHGRSFLSRLISDIDEPIFNNVFAIGLREIQELNALNGTAAAEQLYRLTSGLDRVSLVDVMKDLRHRREKIWSSDQEVKSQLDLLLEQRQKLLKEIDQLKQRCKRWSRLAGESTDLYNQIKDLEKELSAKEKESRLTEIAMQIAERWNSRRYLSEQIDSCGVLPDERDISIPKLNEINSQLAQTGERIDQIKLQRLEIKKEASALPINRALWAQKSRIDAITEHLPWIESLQRQADRIQEEIEKLENSLVGEVDGLGTHLKIKAKDVRDVSTRSLLELENTSRKLEEQQERLRRFQQEQEKIDFDLLQHQERLGHSLNDRGGDSIEDINKYVNRLRRHLELDEKIDKLNNKRHELERDIDSIVAEQVMPVEKLAILGLIFILGVILLGFGLIDIGNGGSWLSEQNRNLGVLFMLLGGVLGLTGIGLKYHWEQIAKEELDDFRHQMDVIRQQLRRNKTEKEQIEQQLPNSVTQYELELKDAENRLAMMEELIPLENRVQATRSNSEELKRRIVNQEREVEAAKHLWQASLRTAGLPEALMPNQLKEITQRSERIATLNLRMDQLQAEKQEKDKELHQLQIRIDDLLHDSGVTADDRSLVERLSRLSRLLNEQKALVQARKEFITKYRNLRSRFNKAKLELEKLHGQKQRLFAQVGVETEDEYRNLETRHRELKKLIKKRDSHTEQILIALGKSFKEKQIQELMDNYGAAGLEKRWNAIQTEIEQVKQSQTQLHQQRGEFIQEVKMLGEDSRLDIVRLELSAVEQKIAECQKEWQVLAASTQIFELIRETYEAKRQPETLKEASGYLERLTNGKYTRIWTRLVGEELLVDSEKDETLSVDKLSRGTRETVFLSLRMALVSAYNRRGTLVPLILDDVLVNFDGSRARHAAQVLIDFAKNGYQILMFTCHGHIRDLFHQLGADVRVLPHHREVFENQAKPLAYQMALPVSAPVPTRPAPEVPTPTASLRPRSEIEPIRIPVELLSPAVSLQPDDFDPDLEFELSAIEGGPYPNGKLRQGLRFFHPSLSQPLELSGNDELWVDSSNPTIYR